MFDAKRLPKLGCILERHSTVSTYTRTPAPCRSSRGGCRPGRASRAARRPGPCTGTGRRRPPPAPRPARPAAARRPREDTRAPRRGRWAAARGPRRGPCSGPAGGPTSCSRGHTCTCACVVAACAHVSPRTRPAHLYTEPRNLFILYGSSLPLAILGRSAASQLPIAATRGEGGIRLNSESPDSE